MNLIDEIRKQKQTFDSDEFIALTMDEKVKFLELVSYEIENFECILHYNYTRAHREVKKVHSSLYRKVVKQIDIQQISYDDVMLEAKMLRLLCEEILVKIPRSVKTRKLKQIIESCVITIRNIDFIKNDTHKTYNFIAEIGFV